MSLLKQLQNRQRLLGSLLTDVTSQKPAIRRVAYTDLANPVTYKRLVAVVVFVALPKLDFFNGDICLLFVQCSRTFCI